MSYKYETHLHSAVGSACARSKGSEYVPYYKSLGYDGIFVTDHFYLGNTAVDRELPWETWVDQYCESYYEAKRAGDEIGLKVFFGWETSYDAEDFLIYGLDDAWLKKHPEVVTWDQKEQYAHIKAEGGMVVQAHPFRERGYVEEIKLHPFHSDAWEIANAGNPAYQDINAYEFAKQYQKHMTCGSDIHVVGGTNTGCLFPMITEKPLNSVQDYIDLVMSGTGYSLGLPEGWLQNRRRTPEKPVFLYGADHVRKQIEW